MMNDDDPYLNLDPPLIERIGTDDACFPERVKTIMGKQAPPELFAMGNKALLCALSLGFCGSRKSSPKGLETAGDCAEQAAQNDIVVVSGNAAGVDFEAHYNCLKAGGATIMVLPEGINHFRIKKAFEPVWDWKRILVVSQFSPDAPWAAYRAMTRNQLIIALSRVMIVIEAGEKGGTLHAGNETLKSGLPLFVAEYQDMSTEAKGNKILLDMGAQRLTKSRSTNRANLEKVFDQVKQDKLMAKLLAQGSLL